MALPGGFRQVTTKFPETVSLRSLPYFREIFQEFLHREDVKITAPNHTTQDMCVLVPETVACWVDKRDVDDGGHEQKERWRVSAKAVARESGKVAHGSHSETPAIISRFGRVTENLYR